MTTTMINGHSHDVSNVKGINLAIVVLLNFIITVTREKQLAFLILYYS